MSILDDITLRRFWSKITVSDKGCWNYDHGFNWESGYPCFWHEGKTWRANKWVLNLFCGVPPQGKEMALHKCANSQCVNPAHLYWGDAKDNYDDHKRDNPTAANFKAQFQKGHLQFWNGNRVLSDIHVSYIKRLCEAGYTDRECARWYEVSPDVIKKIRLGKTFKHVEPYILTPCIVNVEKPEPSRSGRRTLNSKNVVEIRKLFAEGISKEEISKKFSVTQTAIHKVVTYQRWVDV